MKEIDNETFERKKYDVWLSSVRGLSLSLKKSLVESLGSSRNVYFKDPEQLLETGSIDLSVLESLLSAKKFSPDKLYEDILARDMDVSTFIDNDYPALLKEINDCPFMLYYRGRLDRKPGVAVVGSRMCTPYGTDMAYQIGKALASQGINVISGMALGADQASENGAIDAGGTSTAVLGCGPDICYPEENRFLYEILCEKGAVVSEYSPGTRPMKHFFPRRNRIISGMSLAVIVTEARLRSGSLITANLAESYMRDVYAVPGRVTDPLSQGCNHLIEEGAMIMESVDDLIEHITGKVRAKDFEDGIHSSKLTPAEQKIYDLTDIYAIHIDTIREKACLDDISFSEIIDSLTEKGKIIEIFPGYYIRS